MWRNEGQGKVTEGKEQKEGETRMAERAKINRHGEKYITTQTFLREKEGEK